MTDLVKRKVWSALEVEQLKTNYREKTPAEQEALFGVSWQAIKCKAFKLGLNRQEVICDEGAVVAAHTAGEAMKDIVKKHGLSNQAFYKILAKHGVEKKNHNLDNLATEEFTKDWVTLTMPQLLAKYKVSRPTLRNKAKELGLARPATLQAKQTQLTEEQVKLAGQYYNTDQLTAAEVCNKLGVSLGAFRHLVRKNNWKNAKELVQAKRNKGMLQKYGSPSPFGNVAIQKQIKQTSLEKYGTENPGASPEGLAKKTATCIEKYGCTSPLGNKIIQQKGAVTCLEKYGVAHPGSAPEVIAKREATCIEKYGAENPWGNKEVREKSCATMLEKYGTLHPNTVYGKTEKEIGEWLFKTTGKTFKPDRAVLDGKEIDLYNEELKLGIEYCGLYWHHENSPEPRGKNYHYDKYIAAQKKGVRLVTIFEDEWLSRPVQVQGFLASILVPAKHKVYARNCIVAEVPKEEAGRFYDNYHIQGKAQLSVYSAGLFYAGELVGVMSFGKHHRDITKTVLDRLCFKPEWHIAGGASRLFKALLGISKVTEVLSWSDNRWSCGAVYRALGFTLETELAADYSYVNTLSKETGKRLSKQSQKKGNTKCPAGLTEKQWCAERGLYRIWDCGKKRWLYTLPVDAKL